jgi:hypothetical protein
MEAQPMAAHGTNPNMSGSQRSTEESLELVKALFARPDMAEDGRMVLTRHYPQAPEEMLSAARYHLYTEAPRALLDMLSAIELSLRTPGTGRDTGHYLLYGEVFHILYHLYNYLQIEAILPVGKKGLLELLAEVKELIGEDDKEGAMSSLEEINSLLESCESPPRIESD